MDRGLIVGAFAFVAGFAVERFVAGLAKDIARYDAIRAMSDEPPLGRQLLSVAGSLVGQSASKPLGAFSDIASDAVRYAKMRSM